MRRVQEGGICCIWERSGWQVIAHRHVDKRGGFAAAASTTFANGQNCTNTARNPKKTARHSTDLEQMYRPHFHPSKMYTLVHYLMYLILWYIICQVLYLAPPAVPTSPPSSAQTSIVTSTALGTPLVGKRPDCAQRRCDASASARRHRREHRSGPESGTSPRPRAAARGPDTASGRNCAPCEATCRALPKPL